MSRVPLYLLAAGLLVPALPSPVAFAQALPLLHNDSVASTPDGVMIISPHAPCESTTVGVPTPAAPAQVVSNAELGAAAGLAEDAVFGLALLPDPATGETDVLAASTSLYGPIDSAAGANIYRIDGVTGAVSLFAGLPNLYGGGIGDIAYNPVADVVYATNVNDGVITTFDVDRSVPGDPVGVPLGSLDPFAPAFVHSGDVAPVTTVLQERLMALGYNAAENRLYWGRWVTDEARAGEGLYNRVYSVPIDSTGVAVRGVFPDPPWRLEVVLPHLAGLGFSAPVSSIDFLDNADGTSSMLLASRSQDGDSGPLPGAAGVVEYLGTGGAWTSSDPTILPPEAPSGGVYLVGPGDGQWSGGGAAYGGGDSLTCGGLARLVQASVDQVVPSSLSRASLLAAGTSPGLQQFDAANPPASGLLGSWLQDTGPVRPAGLAVCTDCPVGCDDADGDGACDDADNCPGLPNPGQEDADGDGAGDLCDVCPFDAADDADGDGVCGDVDLCPGTVLPDLAPTWWLGPNKWADIDGDGVFETNTPGRGGPGGSYTIEDTGGCSCAQVIDALGLGVGALRFGCPADALDAWIGG